MRRSNRKSLCLLLALALAFSCFSRLLAAHGEEPIIEVRVYKVAEGKMDEWERFFHDRLVEPQEKAGIKILTAYRTLEDENLFVWSRQFSSKANMAKERAAFYQSDQWKNTLRPELEEKGFLEKVETVYTVKPSKGARRGQVMSERTLTHAVRLSGPKSGKNWQIPSLGLELAHISPGSFQMGCDDEWFDTNPVHTVRISQGYWMGKCEVTQQQYQTIMGSNPSKCQGASNPVERVSWNDCLSFCKKLTDRERRADRLPEDYEYRLPTEAEWEYAARGGSRGRDTNYAGSDSIDSVAWYDDNCGSKTHPVGQKQANELGLYDMSDNVSEWCLDSCIVGRGVVTDTYRDGIIDPFCSTGSSRVTRGGGWGFGASLCSVAWRDGYEPAKTWSDTGFRVVLAPLKVENATP